VTGPTAPRTSGRDQGRESPLHTQHEGGAIGGSTTISDEPYVAIDLSQDMADHAKGP